MRKWLHVLLPVQWVCMMAVPDSVWMYAMDVWIGREPYICILISIQTDILDSQVFNYFTVFSHIQKMPCVVVMLVTQHDHINYVSDFDEIKILSSI